MQSLYCGAMACAAGAFLQREGWHHRDIEDVIPHGADRHDRSDAIRLEYDDHCRIIGLEPVLGNQARTRR